MLPRSCDPRSDSAGCVHGHLLFYKLDRTGSVTAVLLSVVRTRHTGRNSSVSIRTRYALYGPGIESRWGGGDIFYRVAFPEVKQSQHGAEVKE